ncbi:MAG TPA: glycosyltransferase, partial [Patescibacteria group bacterium]
MFSEKKIAIVYDWIDKWGGVERILLILHEMFPEADFYTSYFDSKNASWAKNLKIKTSFLQRFPDFIKKSRILSFPFYPYAFESFDFSDYDLVISVTSSFGKSIITKPGTQHICYLLTPTRYLWSHEKEYFKNKLLRSLVTGYLDFIKKWDFVSAQRPDKIISISETVKNRCLKYYKRNSEVIYPGFDINYWKNIKDQVSKIKETDQISKILRNKEYFLLVSRLESYKKVDLTIKVFNKLNKPLIIVGKGSEENKLKQIADKNIIFLSKLSDIELGTLYSNAQALIMPQEEDFGYVSLEAQFLGC